jgi:VWFA-related protein
MRNTIQVLIVSAGISVAAASFAALAATTRTVYVTVTDKQGGPVADLTASNFTVKEGGKTQEIIKAEPAKGRMRLALMVEERLVADGSVRMGLFEFAKRLNPSAQIALMTIGLRNETIVNYTSDLNLLVQGLNGLSLNPTPNSNLTESVLDVAKKMQAERPERPVIVVVALSGGQAGGASAHQVLTELRQSGATLHAVTLTFGSNAAQLATLADESGREQVLGDGAKQSGGRRVEVQTTQGIENALQQVAKDLLAQYVITYALPEGVKPDRRFSASVDRRGVTVRAPTAIPDR